MGVMSIPYGNDNAGKYKNAKWYQGLCNDAGLIPTGCSSNFGGSYRNAHNVYGAGYSHTCNPSSSIASSCGWSKVLTFHVPPASSSSGGGDSYGVCGNGCTISGTTGWSPICM
jgi:hypothetical protein